LTRLSSRVTSTRDDAYSELRERHDTKWWKRVLPVQEPYRLHVRGLRPGFTLDVGCGNGRSLAHLDGNGVGVDHNRRAVQVARAAGYRAYTPEELRASEWNVPGRFDSILLCHVLEHMPEQEAVELVREYLPLLRAGGRVIFLCPQEAGFRSDTTHVQMLDFAALRRLAAACGLRTEREYSHPFPRLVGRFLPYNEFVSIARKPELSAPQPR